MRMIDPDDVLLRKQAGERALGFNRCELVIGRIEICGKAQGRKGATPDAADIGERNATPIAEDVRLAPRVRNTIRQRRAERILVEVPANAWHAPPAHFDDEQVGGRFIAVGDQQAGLAHDVTETAVPIVVQTFRQRKSRVAKRAALSSFVDLVGRSCAAVNRPSSGNSSTRP